MTGVSSDGDVESGRGGGGTAGDGVFDVQEVADVNAWLRSAFEAVGKEVLEFEYTPHTVTHLHSLAVLSQHRTQSAIIVSADLRQRAAEFRMQAARIREILECTGLSQENLSQSGVMSANTLGNVANLLGLKDTETTSYFTAMAELSLNKTELEETRSKAQRESKMLLDYTRKSIARLTYLKRAVGQLEEEVALREGPMMQWNTNLKMMASKERQYLQQLANYKSLLRRLGYTREISHGVLMAMVEHRHELEAKTKPILDTLRSYQDLPPDKALAGLAIEDKTREYEAAEKYLEDALHSALHTPQE